MRPATSGARPASPSSREKRASSMSALDANVAQRHVVAVDHQLDRDLRSGLIVIFDIDRPNAFHLLAGSVGDDRLAIEKRNIQVHFPLDLTALRARRVTAPWISSQRSSLMPSSTSRWPASQA